MGIRFACHVCSKKLNIKRELAGRRGICPACSGKFRIPMEDAEASTPVEPIQRSTLGSRSAVGQPENTSAAKEWIDEQVAVSSSEEEIGPSSEEGIGSSLEEETGEDTWYVRPPSGGQYGPASSEVLKQWVAEGRVADTALLWRAGWPQWRDASKVLPDLADQLPQGKASWGPHSEAGTGSGLATRSARESRFAGAPRSDMGLGKETLVESNAKAGMLQSPKAKQRVRLIGILAALSMLLVGVLVFVMLRG